MAINHPSDNHPSGQVIWDHCESLAKCSQTSDALTRVFLSKEMKEASDLTLGWMIEAGMSARLDALGNVIGRYEGATPHAPCLMLGSHLDTVRNAGKYDGMMGVVAAIECVASLHKRRVRLPFAIEVVGFSDEEGVRYGATLLGSRAIAGSFDPKLLNKEDDQGISMRQALRDFGLDPDKIHQAVRQAKDILAYAELHIEQGPVLESENLPVGVVTAINGANRLKVILTGMAGHAGTVPMNLRKDSLAAAAECILAIEARAKETPELVATVGMIEARPGAMNVIAGKVELTIDIRSPRDRERLEAVADIKSLLVKIAQRRGVGIEIEALHEGATAPCAPWLQQQIGAAISAYNIPVRALPSGAGHDGMAMIDLVPDIGMLFVRCKGGISHNPLESITVEDAEIAAQVFLRFIENFKPSTKVI